MYENKDPETLAYSLFMMTGNPGYYMLYAGIKHADEERDA